MRKARTLWLFVVVAMIAIAGGAAYRLDSFGSDNTGMATQQLFATQFPDLRRKTQTLEQWRGRVLVVNFWATWCPPCREEIPLFVRLQEQYGGRGLQFVGIAIDQPDKVAAFAREFGINYPLLMAGMDTIELMREMGNRAGALPYTLIIDRKGDVVSRETGGLKEARLLKILKPLL